MATATTKPYEYAVRDRSGKIIKGRVEAAGASPVGQVKESVRPTCLPQL